MAKIIFLIVLTWGTFAMATETEVPFRIEMQLIPGKGHTSYADAIERVDIRLVNISEKPQLVQRSDTLPGDDAFQISTDGRLWAEGAKELLPRDDRVNEDGSQDRSARKPADENFQIVAPHTAIYLTSFVIRQPGGKNSPLLAVLGDQQFENLKPGKYEFEFAWAMGSYHSDYSSALAKRKKLIPPWKGLLRSAKFPFTITKKPDGTFECEG